MSAAERLGWAVLTLGLAYFTAHAAVAGMIVPAFVLGLLAGIAGWCALSPCRPRQSDDSEAAQ